MRLLKSHLTSLGHSDRVLAISTRKGHFCYEFITSDSVLDRTEIPSKEEFYSQLRGSGISDSDYSEVIEMWEAAKCTSLRDYMRIYLLIDTLLLTEVFQKFRETMTRDYTLDPIHFVSLPGLAMQTALYNGKLKVELVKT